MTALSRDLRAKMVKSVRAGRERARRRKRNPLREYRWLPNQDAWLRDPSDRKLIRQGNQWGGKTTVALAEVHYHCIGQHPHYKLRHRPPIEVWIICASWSQSIKIQKKFWELIPREHLDPTARFDSKNGFGNKNPMVRYLNGSEVWFKTAGQEGLDLAGATIHVALFDEPPRSERVHGEVIKRLLKTNGYGYYSLTPINAPVGYIRELCEKDAISDHHARLTPDQLIPVGASRPLRLQDGTPMNAAWIDLVRRETLARELPVVVDGEWEVREEGAVFQAFDENVHVKGWIDPPAGATVLFGADHGDGTNFSQCGVLTVVDDTGRYPRVWFYDETVSGGMTTEDMDAAEVVSMLTRNELLWSNLDHAHGDRKHGGRRSGLGKKSNRKLQTELEKLLGLKDRTLKPAIRTVKRGRGSNQGSVSQGCKFLHKAMVRPGHFYVHPRCKRTIESLQKWDYRDTEWKHIIDAWRYSLKPYIFPKNRSNIVSVQYQ